jgi:hypothetical protein
MTTWIFSGRLLMVALGTLLTLHSCKKDDTTPESMTGDITGFVAMVDDMGNRVPNAAGTVAKLEGASPEAQVTTDANGRFALTNVKAGTYNLLLERPGFGTARRLSVAHVGGSQPTFLGQVGLIQTSRTQITNFVARLMSPGVVFDAALSHPANGEMKVGVYASSTPTTSPAEATLVKTLFIRNTNPVGVPLYMNDFLNAGFRPGQGQVSIFLVGMPTVLDGYIDPLTGRLVYLGLGTPSNLQILNF